MKNQAKILIQHDAASEPVLVSTRSFTNVWSRRGWTVAESPQDTAPETQEELPFDFNEPEEGV